jgi:hypothetical protein
MAVFEHRSGTYVWVREHRKRRNPTFADLHQLKGDAAYRSATILI